jgi:hypothetical protein
MRFIKDQRFHAASAVSVRIRRRLILEAKAAEIECIVGMPDAASAVTSEGLESHHRNAV